MLKDFVSDIIKEKTNKDVKIDFSEIDFNNSPKSYKEKFREFKHVNLVEETVKITEPIINESIEVVKDSPTFLGKFDNRSIPNPTEYPENSTYKNINEGVVYIQRNGLWESFLEDGKAQPPVKAWPSGGGVGLNEVNSLIQNALVGVSASSGMTSAVVQQISSLVSYQTLSLQSNVIVTTPSATFGNLQTFSYNIIPNFLGIIVSGTSAGSYTANYNIYTTNDGSNLTKIAFGTITNSNNIDSNIILNAYNNNSFVADVSIVGSISAPGISILVKS